jgi:hypothetical protein
MNIPATDTFDSTPLRQSPESDEHGLCGESLGSDFAAGESTGCCALSSLAGRLPLPSVTTAAMATAALLALSVAGYFAGVASELRRTTVPQSQSLTFPASIDATAAATSEKYSIATGVVSEEAEGFFVLDHNSGLLQCSVFYPRVGKFLGSFTVNAGELVGAGGKGGGYIMVTGQADMTRGGRGAQIAPTLVYVLNTASGNFAAFAVPFNRQAANTGQPQQAALIPMGTGTASVVPTR